MTDMAKSATSPNSHEAIATAMDILKDRQETPELVKKPRMVANKQPKPVSQEPPRQDIDFEDLVAEFMKSVRDARELNKKQNVQALIAQAI